MIGFFLPIGESLLAGYLCAIASYLLLMLLITRLGRKLLMDGDRVSNLYTALLAFTWFVTSFAGVYACETIAPPALTVYGGNIVLPLLLVTFLVLLVVRNLRQMPKQQSMAATVAVLVMIGLGLYTALHVQHAI